MNQSEYVILRQYLGCDLLKYCLNYQGNIAPDVEFNNLHFNRQQIAALESIYSAIKLARSTYIDQNGFGDGFYFNFPSYKINNKLLLNYWREYCGGQYFVANADDKLVSFLHNIAIESYCNLLIKEKGMRGPFPYVDADWERGEAFSALVKNDVLNELTNKGSGLEYRFDFTLNNGVHIGTQICTAFTTIISKSFQNCCVKMNYTLENLLEEISSSIESLRSLARGEEEIFSLFLGAQGVLFKEISCISLNSLKIYPVVSVENPGIHTSNIITQSTDERGRTFYSGAVIEYIYRAKVDNSINRHNANVAFDEMLRSTIENIKLSICFTLKDDYSFAPKFQENGFPLILPGNYSRMDAYPKKYTVVTQANIKELEEWYNKLSIIDKRPIQIAMTRLNNAIHERSSHEDAITDAVIAWEAMFSGKTEAALRVTGSLARYLEAVDTRNDFLKKLKEYYDFRSEIVHGSGSKFQNKSHVEKTRIRDDIISIGIRCLKKIVYDDSILSLKPEERSKKVLILD